MRNLILPVFLLCILAITSCENDDCHMCIIDPDATLDTGAIYGYVTDRWSNALIPDVMVTTDPVTETATTDSMGLYRLNNIPVAAYLLTFSKNGYVTKQIPAAVNDGQVSRLSVSLTGDTPDSLQLLGLVSTGGGTNGIAVRDRIAFSSGDAGLQIFDVTEPTTPTLLGQVWIPTSYRGDVKLYGDVAFVTNHSPDLQIVDISDTAAPLVGTPMTLGGHTHGMELDGDLLVIAADDSVVILDVAIPLTPVRVGAVATEQDGLSQGCYGIALDRLQKIAIVSSFNNGIEVVDYTDPTSPEIIGNYAPNSNPLDAVVDTTNSIAILATDYGLEFVSYAHPSGPQEINRWLPGGNGGRDVVVSQSLAIFAMASNGLYVANISDMNNPWKRQRFTTSQIGSPVNITLENDRAYVACGTKLAVFGLP